VVGRHVAALAGLLGAAVGTALLGDAEACPIDPREVVAPSVLPPRPTVYIGWYLGLPSYPDAWGELERWTAKVTPPAAVVIDPWADVAPWVAPTDRDGHPIRFTIDRIVVADEVILAVHLDATSGQVTLGPQAPGWAPRVELPTDVTSVYDPYRAVGAARSRPTTDVHVRPGIVDSFYGTAGGLLVGYAERILKLWEEARELASKSKDTNLAVPEPGPQPTLDEMITQPGRAHASPLAGRATRAAPGPAHQRAGRRACGTAPASFPTRRGAVRGAIRHWPA